MVVLNWCLICMSISLIAWVVHSVISYLHFQEDFYWASSSHKHPSSFRLWVSSSGALDSVLFSSESRMVPASAHTWGHVGVTCGKVWGLSVVSLCTNRVFPNFQTNIPYWSFFLFFTTDCYAYIIKILSPQGASQFKRRIISAFLISWAKRMPRKSNFPGVPMEKNFSMAKL